MIFSRTSYARKINFIPEELTALYDHSTHPETYTKCLPSWLIYRIPCVGPNPRESRGMLTIPMPHRCPKDHSQYWSVFGTGETGASLLPIFPVLTAVIYRQVKVAQRGEVCLAFALGHVFNCSFLHSFLVGLQRCQVWGKHR